MSYHRRKPMFTKNTQHLEGDLFSPENRLPQTIKKNLDRHWSSVFYRKIFSTIDEEVFAVIYDAENGRPNYPVNILVGLEIIKGLFGYIDEALYEGFIFNYAIQRALGINDIEKAYFCIKTLYNFRSRLAKYDSENNVSLMNEVFKDGRDKIIEELGIKTGLQRVDSVMIAANIKKMSRLALFHKVLSNLVKCLIKLEIYVSENILGIVKEDEDSICYRLASEKVAETIKLIGEKIFELTELHKNNEDLANSKEYLDAIRLLSDQCRIEGRKDYELVRLKAPHEISSGSMQNPADTDATFRKKNDEMHQGYKCHAVETCDTENKMQVITMVETIKNNEDDGISLAPKLDGLQAETALETLITDGGYHSTELIEEAEELEVELVTTAIRGRQSGQKTITTEAFSFNDKGLIEKCPAGKNPVKQILKDGILTASFDKRECFVCTLRDICLAYISEKQCRLVIDSNRRWLDKRSTSEASERQKTLCRMRPAVEGLMEKMKPRYLKGRTMFRFLPRVRNRMVLRAIGLNFRRYLAYLLVSLSYFMNLVRNQFRFCQFLAKIA